MATNQINEHRIVIFENSLEIVLLCEKRPELYETNNCVGSNKHCLSHSSVCKNNLLTGQSGAGIPETYRDSIFWWASDCILTTTSWNENRSSKADLVDKYKVQCVLEQNQKCCGSAINHLVVLPRSSYDFKQTTEKEVTQR